MQKAAPRLLIAGTNSGCGKTTVTCAILQALVDGGVSVAAAKCGPDYIDPMFHREIIGAKSSNLDPFFFDDDTLRFLLAQNGAGKDVTVIEGVMGYYDGIGLDSSRASTFEVAQRTESPVVLVLNAKGAGLSVLAVLDGFLHFATENRIRWAGLEPDDFALITTYENSTYCKPNPAYYREILEKLGRKAEECLMVGNDVVEDGAAQRLGIPVFFLTPCLINTQGKDISAIPHGGFDELAAYLDQLN